MPYKKGSLAEQLGKLRRTAKRRIARLTKEMGRTDNQRERLAYQMQIDSLQEQMARTYQVDPRTHKATGFSHDLLRLAGQNLEKQNIASAFGTSNQRKKNFLTQQEMNMAVSYNFIGPQPNRIPGEFSAEEVSIFYRATQRAWENEPSTGNRNEAILKYYGKEDLRSFVREVLEIEARAVERAHVPASPEYADESEVPTDSEENKPSPSAEWVEYVNILSREKYLELSAKL